MVNSYKKKTAKRTMKNRLSKNKNSTPRRSKRTRKTLKRGGAKKNKPRRLKKMRGGGECRGCRTGQDHCGGNINSCECTSCEAK